MKRITFAFMVLVALLVTALSAVEVTPEQAVTAAQNWVKSNPRRLGSRFASGIAAEIETVSNKTGRTMFHAMNFEGGGFVVTAGDTRLSPIVAFSPTGYYSGDRGSPMFAILLRGMRRQMAVLESQDRLVAAAPGRMGGGTVMRDVTHTQVEAMSEWKTLLSSDGGEWLYADGVGGKTSINDVRVPAILQTRWSQGGYSLWEQDYETGEWYESAYYPAFDYYIHNRPELNNWSVPCGCVATAGAQLMYYWRAPSSFGTFSNTCYTWNYGTKSWDPVSMTSVSGTPAWGSMYLKWDSGDDFPSETARKAVGQLTYNAAVAVGMKWKQNSGSSSLLQLVGELKSRFGYTSGNWVWYVLNADNYSDKYVPADLNSRQADFNNALYASLDAKMPVLMSISGEEYDSY